MGVVNSTSSSTLHSQLQCGITDTEYEYPIPPDGGCHDDIITVTPVNVVGNGSASFIQYSQILTCILLVAIILRIWPGMHGVIASIHLHT